MSHDSRLTRRTLLGTSLALFPALMSTRLWAPAATLAQAAGAACPATTSQGEGPFYPRSFGTPANDLLRPGADGVLPEGEAIVIGGRVSDALCRPLAGAVVEIWQADPRGHYNHPGDRRGSADPRFRYWGRAVTDASGSYQFRTLLPGAYRAGFGWMRPPHVHFKVRPGGMSVLTTQMYFPDQPLNDEDSLFGNIPAERRHTVLAVREPAATSSGGPTPFRFDIAVA